MPALFCLLVFGGKKLSRVSMGCAFFGCVAQAAHFFIFIATPRGAGNSACRYFLRFAHRVVEDADPYGINAPVGADIIRPHSILTAYGGAPLKRSLWQTDLPRGRAEHNPLLKEGGMAQAVTGDWF